MNLADDGRVIFDIVHQFKIPLAIDDLAIKPYMPGVPADDQLPIMEAQGFYPGITRQNIWCKLILIA